jgi:hypothetical protein
LTSDPPENGPPAQNGAEGNRPPAARARRRVDEGDLWADNVESPARAPAPRPGPAPRRRAAQPGATPAAQPPRPATQRAPIVVPPVVPAPEEYDYEDDDDYYDDAEPSLLGNPYVLAAIAVAGAIVLAVIVVLFFGGGGDSQSPGTTADTTGTPTATVEGNDSPSVTGLAARSIAIATVREGPDLSYLELGLLQAGQDVDVVGRNEEATWFQIVFPAGTQLTGWVPDSALRLPENVTALVPVNEPTPVTRPDLPTATTAPEAEETPTPSGEGGVDLAVAIVSDCSPGSTITVSVSNVGSEALDQEPIQVAVSNDGTVVFQQAYQAEMDPGASASLPLDVPAEPPQMAVSVVLTGVEDVDPSNNIASCSVSGSPNNNRNNNDDEDGVPPPVPTQGN